MKVMRKIVYWGAGLICGWCIEYRTDIDPFFLIDSFSEQKELYGKEIKKPDEIEDWTEYYIVITVRHYNEIELMLKSRGLRKNKDYIWYQDFFSCHRPSVD